MVAQAVTASTAAYKAGVKLQKLELLLPLIGATDLDDWCAWGLLKLSIHLAMQQIVQLDNELFQLSALMLIEVPATHGCTISFGLKHNKH